MIRSGTARRRALAAFALAAVLTACTRSSTELEVQAASPSGGSSSASPTATSTANGEQTSATKDRLDNGDFGSLKNVCQSGDPAGSPGHGVTASSIAVGTVTDKGSTVRPGLNKDMWDTAVAFTTWCNRHGGINGRKLVLTDLDAKLMEYPAAISKGCQTDFAMVGGGAALDNGDGGARVRCGLVNIVGFAVSKEARQGGLQIFPLPSVDDRVNGGGLRVLASLDPKAIKTLGTLTGDLQSIVIAKNQAVEYAEAHGYRSVYDQKFSPAGESNWRPFVEEMKRRNVQVFAMTGESNNLVALQKAMRTVGWNPKYTLETANLYDPKFVAEGGSTAKNTWVSIGFHPLELADTNPATADYLELMKRYNPSGAKAALGLQGLSSWLLFARAAKACGDDLTRECLLKKAHAITSWTAGGLHAETNPGENKMSPCFVTLRVTPTGFVYDKRMTHPTKGIYNCDPRNIGKVTPTSGG